MLNRLFGKLRSKWTLFVLLGCLLGLVSGYEWGSGPGIKVVYIYADSVVTLVDTVKVKETVVEHAPAIIDTVEFHYTHRDTVYNTVTDTVIVTEVAKLDTTLADGHLSLRYYVKPRVFDFSWDPVPLEVRCNQVFGGTIGLEPPRLVSFSLGAGIGKSWDAKNWKVSGLLAGHFHKNMLYLEADKEGYTIGYGRRFH